MSVQWKIGHFCSRTIFTCQYPIIIIFFSMPLVRVKRRKILVTWNGTIVYPTYAPYRDPCAKTRECGSWPTSPACLTGPARPPSYPTRDPSSGTGIIKTFPVRFSKVSEWICHLMLIWIRPCGKWEFWFALWNEADPNPTFGESVDPDPRYVDLAGRNHM